MNMVEKLEYLRYSYDHPYQILLELAVAVDNLQEQVEALERMIVDTYATKGPTEGGLRLG